jgi:hypothetical protein
MLRRVRKEEVQVVDEKKNDREALKHRLEIWGRFQRGGAFKTGGTMSARETRSVSPYGGQGYQCMTAVVCNILASAAAGPAGWSESNRGGAKLNKNQHADVALITSAWLRLPERPKLVIKHAYVLNSPPVVICRKLLIPFFPASHFKRELDAAELDISKMLDTIAEENKILLNNSFPSDMTCGSLSAGPTVSEGNEKSPSVG